MKTFARNISLTLVVALLWSAAARSAAAPLPTLQIRETVKTLANGLRVVVIENHAVPVVQTGVWYRFGSVAETPGKTGLAHALEHMMYRGTPSLSEAGLSDYMTRTGAEVNAETTYDSTHFFFLIPADKLDATLRIEADRMQHLALRPEDWDVERGAVLSEIDSDFSAPFINLITKVRAAVYPGSRLGQTPLGDRSDVAHASAADIRTYYDAWYAPNNATLVIAGNVRTADALREAESIFGAIPAKTLPPLPSPSVRAAHGVQVISDLSLPIELADLAYAIPGAVDEHDIEPVIIAEIIENPRSPFYQRMVESGLALGLAVHVDDQLQGGVLHAIVVVRPPHGLQEVEDAFRATMRAAIARGFDASLVAEAKRRLFSYTTYASDSIGELENLVGYSWGVEQRGPNSEDAKLAALDASAIRGYAQIHLGAPNVVGELRSLEHAPRAEQNERTSVAADDNFNHRLPNGEIVQPDYIRATLATPEQMESTVHPASFHLPNGILVLVQPVHTNATVYVQGRIETSPRSEPAGKEGVAILAERLMNFGSSHYTFAAQRQLLGELAANADFGTVFGERGYAKDFNTLLALLADVERSPSIPQRYFDLQKAQLASEVSHHDGDPNYTAARAFKTMLLPPGDPELREPTPASVARITRDDVIAYTQRVIRPELMTVAVAGDLSASRVREAMQRYFADWHVAGAAENVALPQVPSAPSATRYIAVGGTSVAVRMGQTLAERGSPDYFALQLLNELLGAAGDMDTRLMRALRIERGLVYSVESEITMNKYRGTLTFRLQAAPRKAHEAVALLKTELLRLQTEAPSQAELQRAKDHLISSTLLREESTNALAATVLEMGIYGLPSDYYKSMAGRFNAVTPAQIQNVAQRYLRPNDLIEVYSWPG